ncbi:MAG: O-antigen ligase family protein [Acidobacteriota bacterium]
MNAAAIIQSFPSDRARQLLPGALVLLSPFFLFPSTRTVWLCFLFPLLFLALFVRKDISLPRSPVDIFLLVLTVQVLISGLIVAGPAKSLPKVAGYFFGLFVFYTLIVVCREPKWIRFCLFLFLGGGVVLSIVGVLGISRHEEPKYIHSIYRTLKSLPSVEFRLPGAEKGFHPNALGGALTLILPLVFVLILPYLVKNKREFRIKHRNWIVPFLVAGLIILGGAMLLTQSRSSFAGMFIAGWLFLFVGLRRKKTAVLVITLLMAALLVGIFLLAGSDKLPYTDLESRNKLGGRLIDFWIPAFDAIKDKPIFGIGFNAARDLPSVGDSQGHLHNQILHTAAELGIPAAAAYLGLLIMILLLTIRTWKSSATGWLRTASLGLAAGQLAFFVFGFLDVISLGAKAGLFFWFSFGLIVSIYSYSGNLSPITSLAND